MKELLKEFEMIRVDFANSVQGADFLRLLGEYALDPMGGGEALDKNTLSNLIERAQNEAGFGAFLAYVGGEAVGLLNFNRTFSTFSAAPILGIHDICVSSEFRRKGVASALLKQAEQEAIRLGCCKLTLEVLTKNTGAQAVYRSFGFGDYCLDPQMGTALFWQKKILIL